MTGDTDDGDRRPYEPPEVVVYGSAAELTAVQPALGDGEEGGDGGDSPNFGGNDV